MTKQIDPLFFGISLQEEIYLRSYTIFTTPIFKYRDMSSYTIKSVILILKNFINENKV